MRAVWGINIQDLDMATKYNSALPQGVTQFYDFSGNDPEQGAAASAADNGDGGKGGTSSTTTTTTTYSSPYAQFKGSNNEDVINFIKERMGDYKPETPEEREKRERREKRTMFLARIANVLGDMHKAYSYQRGVKPMDVPDVTAKARERIEKAKAERDKENDRILNYAITLGKLKDADRDFGLKVTQAEQQQSNWQQQFDAGRKDRADDVAFRDKKFDTENEHWQKGFDEGVRQFDVTSAEHARHNQASEGLQAAGIAETRRHNQASEGLQAAGLAASQDGKYTEFYTPSGGLIKVRNTALNSSNVAYVFKQTGLPATKRVQDGLTFKEEALTEAEMMRGIGANIDNQNVQQALRNIGGIESKGTGYGGGGKGKGY